MAFVYRARRQTGMSSTTTSEALGPGSYGGARERDSVRGAPFGTARRDTGMVRPGRVPGPGAYGDLSVMGIGAKTTTIARSQTKGFGGGPRLAPDTALKSPGPGTYYDHKANLWIKRVGSGRDQPATASPTGRTLSATNRRALSSSADRPPSAAPPSIPARAQSHGYEPSPDDTSRDMIPIVPTTRDTYSGRGDDRIGPDRYSPGVVAGSMKGVDPHKTTDFASSKAKRRPVPDEPARSPGTRYLDEVKTRLAPMAYAGGRDERVSRDSFKESVDAETDGDEASDAEKTRETASVTTRSSVRKPSTAGFAAVRRGSASRQSASRRKPSATKQTPGPGEYVTNVSGFDRTRSPSRVQALGGTERGHRHGAEAVPSRGPSRSSAWDDDIASPGANRMNSTASSPSPYDTESPRLVLDATGRSDDFDTLGRTSRASSAGGRYPSRPQTGFGTGKRSSLSARSHSPGPGAYEVKLASALSPSSRKGTFGRSMSGGDLVGMGTGTTNGGMNGGIDSPGPGHYDAHAGREVPSSPSTKSHVVGGFVTAARRNDSTLGNTFVRGRSAGTGGGGGGGTRDAATNNNAPRTPNRGFGRQAARGKGYDANPVANFPGPGSYDWMYGENDAWERRRIVNETSGTLRLNASTGVGLFGTGPRIAGTNSASHDGPNGSASPGPGHYTLDSGADRGRVGGGGGRSSFRSGTVRGGDPAFRGGPSPGPARYYPDDTIVRRSYNVTAR